jgi:ABC-2 type transport system permease protein
VLGWLHTYFLMIKWHALSYRSLLPIYMSVNIMMTLGIVIGITLFMPPMYTDFVKYLITGSPTVVIMTTGLVMVPQMVAAARLEQTFDYMWSLPVPRIVYVAADNSVWFLIALPGVILSLVIGPLYHDFTLEVSPLVVPAFLLMSVAASFGGYAFALAVPSPRIAQVISQVIIFIFVFFSPVIYPPERLPEWMAAIHKVLPFQYMADLSRGTLTDLDINLGLVFAVTGAWCAAAFIVSFIIIMRRH